MYDTHKGQDELDLILYKKIRAKMDMESKTNLNTPSGCFIQMKNPERARLTAKIGRTKNYQLCRPPMYTIRLIENPNFLKITWIDHEQKCFTVISYY